MPLSVQEKQRIDEAHKNSTIALTKISDHEKFCGERWEQQYNALDKIRGLLWKAAFGIIGLLASILIKIIFLCLSKLSCMVSEGFESRVRVKPYLAASTRFNKGDSHERNR